MRATDTARRRLLRSVARGQRGVLTLAITAGAVRQLGFLALPWCLQHAVDDGLVPRDLTILAWWAAAVVGASVVQAVGVSGWDWWANLADGRAGIVLRRALARRIATTADDQGHGGVGSGDLLLRSGRDVDLVRVWVHGLPTWSVIVTTVVVLVPGMLSLSPLLLAVAVAVVPCLVVIGLVQPRRYEAASALVAESHGRRAEHVDHAVASAVTSRGVGGGDVIAARHAATSAELAHVSIRATDRLARWQAWGVGVPTVAVAVGLLVGVLAVLDDRLSVGGLVAFSTWMGTIGVAVDVGLMRWAQTLDARVAADRLAAVLGDGGLDEQVDREDLRRPRVDLLDVGGLTVRPGQVVALTGPTGCGKSTLLARLASEHAESAVLVPQRPLVMAGTVRDNIALLAGDESTELSLRVALADVGLDVELDLDDVLLDGADGLSGGQVQRLALARALVCDPPVLLLDDVTSAVDERTEALVLATLRRRGADRITVVATHRTGVLAAVDGVVTMEPVA